MGDTLCVVCGTAAANASDDSVCAACRKSGGQRPASKHSEPLQPSLMLATCAAIACAVAFYGLGPMLLLRDTYAFHLFCGHGWVPYVSVLLFFTAFWQLILKLPILRREESAFALSLLPEDVEARIESADAHKILKRISRLQPRQRSLLLVTRVRQAILRLNQLGTAEKLDDLLRYRAEADLDAVESAYSAPRFIIWAIPVLGFVGTVLGISNGVQAFSTLIQNAADLEGLRESLKGVTYGLGQAFETTMVALCMSLLLMLLMSLLQRREDRLLRQIDDYCQEHLMHKISVTAGEGGLGPADIRSLTEALRECRDATLQLANRRTDIADALPPTPAAQGQAIRNGPTRDTT